MKDTAKLWKVISWLFIICAVLAYFSGWANVVLGTKILGVDTAVYFYDAMAAGILGLFFMFYALNRK